MYLKELEKETSTTRKMLSRIPNDKYGWQPHQKSMTMQRLAVHIAELPAWIPMILTTTELDFSKGEYKAPAISNTAYLMEYFEKNVVEGRKHLQSALEEQLDESWTLRNGSEVYDVSPKNDVIRMTFCQMVHHRAQLGVYLRLLDIPIPGSYGPSADEDHF